MAREIINVGSAPNDGTGDPIRQAYIKCNNNFSELYSFRQSDPPPTPIGSVGDIAGMYAYDENNFYWCFQDYDGVSVIWNETLAEFASAISDGTSNVAISSENGPVTVSVNGVSNVAVFADSGLTAANANIGNLTTGNILPSANAVYDLGNASLTYRDLYLSGETIFLGPSEIAANASALTLTAPEGGQLILTGAPGNVATQVGQLDVIGNIQVGNLNSQVDVTATGNVRGAFLIGDGSFLSNVTAVSNLAVTSLANASSVLNIPVVNGPILFRVDNQPNVAVINSTGANINGYLDVSGNTVTANLISTNAVSTINVVASGDVTATGNVSGAYILGNVSQATGVFTTKIFNGTSEVDVISANGSIRSNVAGNAVQVIDSTGVTIVGNVSATGNIIGDYVIGNGSQLTGIDAAAIQSGNSAVRVLSSNGNIAANIAGNTVQTISSTGVEVSGNVTANNFIGTIQTASQPFITQLGELPSLTVTTITGNSATYTGNVQVGNLSVTGNVNFSGNINQISGNSGQFFGEIDTGFQALYAGIPTGYTLLPQEVVQFASNFNGYVQFSMQNDNGGNEASTDLVITADNGTNETFFCNFGMAGSGYDPTVAGLNNGLGTALSPNDCYIYIIADADTNPGLGGNIVIGTPDPNKHIKIINGGSEAADISAQFNPVASATSNATGTFTVVGGIGLTGNSYFGGTITVNESGNPIAIINAAGNGVGNIGSASTYFNTVFAKSTSAQYADLAEQYRADREYPPGTVLKFGGTAEVTECDTDHDAKVVGVVSENPAYLMNTGMTGDCAVAIALAGRVKCRVKGSVQRGDMLVSAGNGCARAESAPSMGTVIGKSLVDFHGDSGTIEIVIGRL